MTSEAAQMRYTYKGRDVNTLTPAELREALQRTIDQLQQMRQAWITDIELEQELAAARRALAWRRPLG